MKTLVRYLAPNKGKKSGALYFFTMKTLVRYLAPNNGKKSGCLLFLYFPFAAVKKRSKMKISHAFPVILMSTFISFSSLFASEAIYTDWIKESDVVMCIDSEDRYTVERPNVLIGNIKEVGAILPREVKKCTIIISKNLGKTKKSNIEKKEVSETLIRLLPTLGCSEYKIFQAAVTLAGMGEIK